MNSAEQDKLISALKQRKTELAATVHARLHGHGLQRHDEAALPRRGDDTDDDGSAETQRSADVAQVSRAADELAAIEAALARAEHGGYGHCIDCGKTIELARLQAQPVALRCTACQSALEQKQRR